MKHKYKDESELLKAVAHPMRLQIIELLLLGLPIEGCSVTAIQKKLAIPQSTISQHLQTCLLYTSPSPRDRTRSRMPSSA